MCRGVTKFISEDFQTNSAHKSMHRIKTETLKIQGEPQHKWTNSRIIQVTHQNIEKSMTEASEMSVTNPPKKRQA